MSTDMKDRRARIEERLASIDQRITALYGSDRWRQGIAFQPIFVTEPKHRAADGSLVGGERQLPEGLMDAGEYKRNFRAWHDTIESEMNRLSSMRNVPVDAVGNDARIKQGTQCLLKLRDATSTELWNHVHRVRFDMMRMIAEKTPVNTAEWWRAYDELMAERWTALMQLADARLTSISE